MSNAFDRERLEAAAGLPIPADLLKKLETRLQQWLPNTAAPQQVAARLQQFILAARSPTSLLAFLDRDEASCEALLKLLGTGQRLADQLVAAPESLDLVRVSQGAGVSGEILVDEIVSELDAVAACGGDRSAATALLRSLINRERLRIAYGQWVASDSPTAAVATHQAATQLTVLADSAGQAVLDHISRQLKLQHGWPQTPQGQPAKVCLIGLGDWAASELSYDSPLEAFFLCELSGPSDGAESLSGDEFFRRLVAEFCDLLAPEATAPLLVDGRETPHSPPPGYPFSLAKRPLGNEAAVITTVTEAERHYQLTGRTWERLLLVKCRTVAGDQAIGQPFITAIQPWVYRRYFRQEDSDGLRTTVRKTLRQLATAVPSSAVPSPASGQTASEIAQLLSRPGGLAEVQTTTAILQAVYGGEDPTLRVANTEEALQRLLAGDHLPVADVATLIEHFQLLQRCRHLFQVSGLNDTAQPNDDDWRAAAWNLGYRRQDGTGDPDALQQAIQTAIDANRQILLRLLTGVIGSEQQIPAEAELVLDPDPEPAWAAQVLAQHGLSETATAVRDLQRLAVEPVPFLSSRRSRHHLAAVAAQLLAEVARTPEPHPALTRLADVGDSLGGKAVLWELFRVMPSAMTVFVRMCAGSPYLSGLLTANPGMVDELIDSLELDRLPTADWLDATSTELCRAAADVPAVLQSFKNAAHLQIGVRDCLGKDQPEATHRALADTAEVVVRRLLESQHAHWTELVGDPCGDDGQPAEGVLLAFGTLGGREPNYHSTLSLAMLYTANGQSQRRIGGPRTTINNQRFFSNLIAGLIPADDGHRAAGDLYNLYLPSFGSRAEETVRATQIDSFAAHFLRGQASLAQRLMLSQARPISGTAAAQASVRQAIVQWLSAGEWFPQFASQIHQLRLAAETNAKADNLKRSAGGTLDVELIAQTLKLCHARQHPEILVPGTLPALQQLATAGLIDQADADALQANYRLLRNVESKIRLLDLPQRHTLPRDRETLDQLAYLLQPLSATEIVSHCDQAKADNRRRFLQLIDRLSR